MSHDLTVQLKNKIKEVYKNVVLHGEGKVIETNSSVVYLLGELENEWERLLRTIYNPDKNYDPEIITKIAKDIQKERKNENIQKNKEEQLELERKKKNESSKKNRIIEIKRRAMQRSKPKVMKKKVTNNNKLSQEDIDKQYYIGIY